MVPSEENILETISEVMSQPEFKFEELPQWDIPHFDMTYFFLFLIISLILFLVFIFLKDYFQPSKKKLSGVSENKIIEKKLLPSGQIERLHAEFLSALNDRKIVTLHKWETNSDYTLESQNPLFKSVCMVYDLKVFGKKEISLESTSMLKEQFKIWMNGS